jgi:peptidyl-prolyl cis-trans isomerase C
MNRMLAATCTLAIAAFATACTQKPDGAAAGKTDNIAVVDGHAISRATYIEYVKGAAGGKAPSDLTEEQRKELLDNLVRAQVIAADSEAKGLTKDPETIASLDLARWNVVNQVATRHFLKENAPTEAALRAEYDKQVAEMSKVEYRASHILVDNEEQAKQLIVQLKGGANFATLAGKFSKDSVSKEHGGDLDWFSPKSMTPVFAEAVTKLKKGETSSEPVKTEYGWHVLRVTDVRDTVAPPYESVKERVKQLVEAKKFRAYTDELIAKAKVTKTP